ncbi:MAG: recombination-associated protein RdgC [Pseudomonadota bacterium]|nr:MAG: recombination-associated protein RdgC [Pseudomonadota bacterium]
MFFKNLCLYRLPTPWDISAAELESRLDARPLNPCGHFDMTTRGWVPVGPTARRLHTVENHQMIALGVEQKLLPASVIRQVAADRAAEVAAEQGFPVGRKQMRDIRLRVTEELRARALVKRRVTHAWLDRANGWLVVDAAGVARAEEVVETLRDTLGSFAATQVNTATSPRAAMARWAASGEVGHHIGVDDELELQAVDGSRATIRHVRHAFDQGEVRRHLSQGFMVTRLGLTWNGRISFVLTDKLQVKRVDFQEMKEAGSEVETQDIDPLEQFDIDFAVMSGELSKLIGDLVDALGGEVAADATPQVSAA